MHKFAFGELGWLPYDYYCSTPYDFFAACEGYFDKCDRETRMHRLMAYRVHQSLVEKPIPIEDFAPVWNDSKANPEFEITQEFFDELAKTHNL